MARSFVRMALPLVLAGCSLPSDSPARPAPPAPEERAVYEAVLAHLYKADAGTLVVYERPLPWHAEGMPLRPGGRGREDIGDELIADFVAKDSAQGDLPRELLAAMPVRVFSTEEMESLKLSTDRLWDWDEFHRRYPSSGGVTHLSAVGFNPERTKALAAAIRGCGLACGEGALLLLGKEGGRWVVTRTVMAMYH